MNKQSPFLPPKSSHFEVRRELWRLAVIVTAVFTFYMIWKGLTTEASASVVSFRPPEKGLIVQNTPPTRREQVLWDPLKRLPPAFQVPASMKERVQFWFDIYTVYSANHYVVHHEDMPWLIFNVLDTTSILNGPGKRKIGRAIMAEKFVCEEYKRILSSLKKLAKNPNRKNLNDEERRWLELTKLLPGKLHQNLKGLQEKVRMQRGQRDFMLSAINTSTRYLPNMERTFESYGLPVELTRLPLVESSFNVSAVSKVGAAGVWQIMPDLGKRFLIMNELVDERKSPFKAAEVAARILKENIQILKEWPLAVTAYNHGPGGLVRAVRQHGTTDLGIIVRKKNTESFGFATSNFYSEFVAALFAEKYKDKIFKQELLQEQGVDTDSFVVKSRASFKWIAKKLGLEQAVLTNLNPDINPKLASSSKSLPRGYELILPKGYGEKLRPHVSANSRPGSGKPGT